MARTIQETIDRLHSSLKEYIEATYHIGDAALIEQRRTLLDRTGVTHQEPFLETTPRYQVGAKFRDMDGLPTSARTIYEMLAGVRTDRARLLFDPPYRHQADAVGHALVEGRNLVIMTGTGSGKTESFLLPILGKFAREAAERPVSFAQPAMRALLLYPMNALVNDQLGRLRAIFGDPDLVAQFTKWAGRPPRFARYTSRTPYAGVRSGKKDGRKLASFEDFYVEIERQASGPVSDKQKAAARLREQLQDRGKWPAKPDLDKWYGAKGSRWVDPKTGDFLRAVTLDEDSELITRHEVQETCPDLMVTNYSMLEYMMMRPIERPIFDATRGWLAANPNEKFTVVLDEAHLYRGAAGAEVGLLLRRLRDRLEIPADRFQVICATASFEDKVYATEFGAQLSGVPADSFVAVTGVLDMRSHAAPGTKADAEVLASLDLELFYSADEADRAASVAGFLAHRGVVPNAGVERDLFEALKTFPPLGLLVNETMGAAQPVAELGSRLFPDTPDTADSAVTALLAVGSVAREQSDASGPLPCRVHNFYRGLPGLWVCMDPDCTELAEEDRNGICGMMYGQPHEVCGCGSRVLEFFTCRSCGSAYARAYSDDLDSPDLLWSEPGRRLRMPDVETLPLLDLDLLLEAPKKTDLAELAEYDLDTGRLSAGQRTRTVYIRKDRITPAVDDDDDEVSKADDNADRRGQFVPCAVCGETASGRTTVQDHQTKGDQPFQALVARQLAVQPPGKQAPSAFAPLRGRKVLVFSDSRQVAARLAPNLQMYSVRDALRSLILWGYGRLSKPAMIQPLLSLDELYLSVLLASKVLGVRLRPELKSGENFFTAEEAVEKAVAENAETDDTRLAMLWMETKTEVPPAALLDDIVKTVQDRYLGLEALALASIRERANKTKDLHALPDIPGIAENDEDKVALARAWLRCWRSVGFWLNSMPSTWYKRPRGRGTSVGSRKGTFKAMDIVLRDPAARKAFKSWTQPLLDIFTQDQGGGARRLMGQNLSLELDGDWRRCADCKSVHRPVRTIPHCLDCGSDAILELNPLDDSVFVARKGYYRSPVLGALRTPREAPMALIAAEHTAQLNAPQSDDVFSKAEENELLFQDVELDWGPSGGQNTAIDVLSSTTTMEVGIDIGALSGVALRNMPPGRANYQQRAGRAGRRGNAVATVVAFGSADSHDEHYFSEPKEMISGKVIDPKLTLDNPDIVKRHIRAYLLQAYHQVRIPVFDPSANPDLFSVLGSVEDFKTPGATLNAADFKAWLSDNESGLRERVASWIPEELVGEIREALLDEIVGDCSAEVDKAIANDSVGGERFEKEDDGADEEGVEMPDEVGEEAPPVKTLTGKLLDRLLYKGVLPRYAFPTDVATFSVFDKERSTPYRHVMKFAPSQGLPVALSQYAPGKQVWISGKCYTSGAIYSQMPEDRFDAWQNRRLYRECTECGFAETVKIDQGLGHHHVSDCYACGSPETFGPTRYWLRPPGFAHPLEMEEVTSPDDMPETSYATRAKLVMPTPADDDKWIWANDRIRAMPDRQHLLVSNTGPKQEGYNYCTLCGLIESSAEGSASIFSPHLKPFPHKEPTCPGSRTSRHIVLGTDFITDIALFSVRVEAPLKLKSGYFPTDVALRTVSEALAKAACAMLEVEPGELMAEYRPALTQAGKVGLEAEIFLYDTLPGGAGFSRQLADRGLELFQRALTIMKTCREDCDSSCYRCLRSFKNKFEHGQLDRHVGAELVEFLLTDHMQPFSPERVDASTKVLMLDLERNADSGVTYQRDAVVSVPGMGDVTVPILATRSDGVQTVIALAGPLTEEHPSDPRIAEMREKWDGEVVPINELLVRGKPPDGDPDG